MDRRRFLRLAGGGVVVMAGGGLLTGYAVSGVPASAVAAWRGPSQDLELRRWVLSYALLAPNPHNRQPWMADLAAPGEILLRLDPERLLPATDPHGRQILMGAGAFLELLAMAAAERGHRAEVSLFPQGEAGGHVGGAPFARVRLAADAGVARDPLFAQVLRRRTDRRAYDPARPVSVADADRLRAALGTLPVRFGLAGRAGEEAGDAARLESIRDVARQAWRIELTTERTMMESIRLLRIGSAEIDRHRDGIVITAPLLVVLSRLGLFDRDRFPAPDSRATVGQLRTFDAVTASTPAYLWLVTEGNSRTEQIAAGRAYARVNLAGAAAGLAMHPNEQSLQEYPEVAAQHRAIHALLGAPAPGATVQMLARVGYPPANASAAPPAPRRGLGAHLAG